MTVVDLELTLRPAGHGYHAEARCRPPGSEAPIDAAATVQIEPARLLALTSDPAAYGLALGQMVLVEAISRALDQSRVAAQRAGVPLRLRLVVPPELHLLRWETLRDPAHPDTPLLTMGGQILFSRYLSSADWTPVGPRPLGGRRALVLLASPSDLADYGLAPFDVDAERVLIAESMAPILTTVLGAGQATLGALVEALRSGPDILYLIAHGRVDEAGETLLYLEGADGKTTPVRGSAVATRIAEQAVRPQLVILGSCESTGDGHGEALLTLGPLLARAGVSAVLAMQGRVTQETLRIFTAGVPAGAGRRRAGRCGGEPRAGARAGPGRLLGAGAVLAVAERVAVGRPTACSGGVEGRATHVSEHADPHGWWGCRRRKHRQTPGHLHRAPGAELQLQRSCGCPEWPAEPAPAQRAARAAGAAIKGSHPDGCRPSLRRPDRRAAQRRERRARGGVAQWRRGGVDGQAGGRGRSRVPAARGAWWFALGLGDHKVKQ